MHKIKVNDRSLKETDNNTVTLEPHTKHKQHSIMTLCTLCSVKVTSSEHVTDPAVRLLPNVGYHIGLLDWPTDVYWKSPAADDSEHVTCNSALNLLRSTIKLSLMPSQLSMPVIVEQFGSFDV